MNPAVVPVQLDIPSSKLIFSSGWLYSTRKMDKYTMRKPVMRLVTFRNL